MLTEQLSETEKRIDEQKKSAKIHDFVDFSHKAFSVKRTNDFDWSQNNLKSFLGRTLGVNLFQRNELISLKTPRSLPLKAMNGGLTC